MTQRHSLAKSALFLVAFSLLGAGCKPFGSYDPNATSVQTEDVIVDVFQDGCESRYVHTKPGVQSDFFVRVDPNLPDQIDPKKTVVVVTISGPGVIGSKTQTHAYTGQTIEFDFPINAYGTYSYTAEVQVEGGESLGTCDGSKKVTG